MKTFTYVLVTMILACPASGKDSTESRKNEEQVVAFIIEINNICYFRENRDEAGSKLDPKNDRNKKLSAGQQLRCEPGGSLKIYFYKSKNDSIIQPHNWYKIPNVPATHPARKDETLPGRHARGTLPVNNFNEANAVNNPSEANVVDNSDAVKRALLFLTPDLIGASPVNGESGALHAPVFGSRGLNITIKQVPDLMLDLRRNSERALPGQSVEMSLRITNSGNKEDRFRLETDLSAYFQPLFVFAGHGASDTGLPVLVTPQLARGDSIDVFLRLRVPETATDGQQRRFFVSATSQADAQVSKVADGTINVVAPVLGTSFNIYPKSVKPGETFAEIIRVHNRGSSAARDLRATFNLNPNFEFIGTTSSSRVFDSDSKTATWSRGDLNGLDSRTIGVTMRVVQNALAADNQLWDGTLRTMSLPTATNFYSPSVSVARVPLVRLDVISTCLTATPGDTVYLPFIVHNLGNATDSYQLGFRASGSPPATIFADANADGQHQEGELAIVRTTPLKPFDGQFSALLGVRIPPDTPDRQQLSYTVWARSLASERVTGEAETVLTVAVPRVRVRTERVTDLFAPGETIYYRLVLMNEGSGLAENLLVVETLPDALQFISSEPSLSAQDASVASRQIMWSVNKLAPGETAVLRIAVRLKPNLPAEMNLTTSHSVSYRDSNGNEYRDK